MNNVYLVHTLDPLAIKYNDSGVLENTHVACLYSMVTSKPNSNIFANIKDDKISAILFVYATKNHRYTPYQEAPEHAWDPNP